MRKSIVPPSGAPTVSPTADGWLDLQQIASAEISSEDPQHPFERDRPGDHVTRAPPSIAPDLLGGLEKVPHYLV